MIKRLALQMNDIEKINVASDTTYLLGLEAQRRGYQLYYYQPDQMFLEHGEVKAHCQKLTLSEDPDNYYTLERLDMRPLRVMDIILLRQDPPFNMDYLTTTYYLETLKKEVLILNDSVGVRNAPEKLLCCRFPDIMPPTLMSKNIKDLHWFWKSHGDIVLKPLYAHGGEDIHLITADGSEDAFSHQVEKMLLKDGLPIIAQMKLNVQDAGDKRIILIDGKPVGAVNRMPQSGEIRSNLILGAKAEKTSLTAREEEICELIGPTLQSLGLFLAGIDVIDGYLTEINVTSPTGIASINHFNGVQLEKIFWDAVEKL